MNTRDRNLNSDILNKFNDLTETYKSMFNGVDEGLNKNDILNLEQKDNNKELFIENMRNVNSNYITIKKEINKINEKIVFNSEFENLLNSYVIKINEEKDLYEKILNNKLLFTDEKNINDIKLDKDIFVDTNFIKITIINKLLTELNCINSKYILKKNEYQDYLNELKDVVKNSIEKENINELKKELHCGICFENNIKYCINPCGHTFCENCTKKLNRTCFFCNQSFTSKIKLFLSCSDDKEESQKNIVNNFDNSEYEPRILGSLYSPVNENRPTIQTVGQIIRDSNLQLNSINYIHNN